MGNGRKIIDELMDVFRKQVDEIERASTRGLDRLVERGVEELEAFRAQAATKSRPPSPPTSPTRPTPAAPPVPPTPPTAPTPQTPPPVQDADRASRNARSRERLERRAVKAAKRERRAERNARRAFRSAERARRRAEGIRSSRRSRQRNHSSARNEEGSRSPDQIEHDRLVFRARRRANQRIAFLTHLGSYVATLAIVLVTTRSIRVFAIVGLSWGIGVFCHYLWALTAPKLRDRWVEQEVGTRSAYGVKTERRVVETRSRRSLEDLSASIAHEIRNPITAAKSLVQQMGEDPASSDNLEYAETALSELDRVERSISHLLRYARDEEPRISQLELRAVAVAAVEGIMDRATSSGVDLSIEFDRPGAMRGDDEKLRRVVENLISNALEAIAAADIASPQISILGGENLAGDEIWLRVSDNGPGITAEDSERIWSPFYTTREKGTGLGLALSRKTIEAHGGRIELLTDARQGTEFVLSFPKDPNSPSDTNGGDN
jgi:signal transduction histidine kinase